MGNTKTYYLEGELNPGVGLADFKSSVKQYFHASYCVAEIVEQSGGYLGVEEGAGRYLVSAIHTSSLLDGIEEIKKLFCYFFVQRYDHDNMDVYVEEIEDGIIRSNAACLKMT